MGQGVSCAWFPKALKGTFRPAQCPVSRNFPANRRPGLNSTCYRNQWVTQLADIKTPYLQYGPGYLEQYRSRVSILMVSDARRGIGPQRNMAGLVTQKRPRYPAIAGPPCNTACVRN